MKEKMSLTLIRVSLSSLASYILILCDILNDFKDLANITTCFFPLCCDFNDLAVF